VKNKIAIVYIAHDGFTSLYTGVGTVARDFLLTWKYVKKELKNKFKETEFDFYPTTIKYKTGCFGYSESYRDEILKYINGESAIYLTELLNDSAGMESYSTIANWNAASISAATFLKSLVNKYSYVIAITVDTPFAQVANKFFEVYDDNNIQIIWLPQSTVKVHKYGKSSDKTTIGKSYEDIRFEWEKGPVSLANKHKQVYIGFTSHFMKNHLIKEYGAINKKLISIQNSLDFNRLMNNLKSQNYIKQLLVNKGVPIDKPLIFTFGRAELYKGIDILLKSAKDITQNHKYYILVITSPYTKNDPYLKELYKLSSQYPKDIKIITGLDFITPHYILQWHQTKILALFSRAEPFGLIPIEARFYNNKSLVVLTSNLGGFVDQITNGKDGFLTNLDKKSIKLSFKTISNLKNKEINKISTNGYNRVIKNFDMKTINVQLFTRIISKIINEK